MKRYNMSKDIAVKIINIRNPFNNDLSKEFIYDGIDARGNRYTFRTTQVIPCKNYICLSLFKYDILEKNNVVCKQYTIYPLSVKDDKLYLYDTPFKSDKIN